MATFPELSMVCVFLAAVPIACQGTGATTEDPQPEVAGVPEVSDPASMELEPSDIDPGFRPAETVSRRGPEVITREILQGSSGDLWIASFSGFYRYDGAVFTNITNEAGLLRTRAFSLFRDDTDTIWLGTLGAGVYRVDDGAYTNITSSDGLAGDRVLAMAQDSAHNIWFGFAAAGATRYDGTQFTSFGEKDGFTDGDVSSIADDRSGGIWFGSREGLYFYDGDSFVNFSERWGLSTGGHVPTLVDASGHLWFGGADGFHRYDGESLRNVTSEPSWALLEEDSAGNIWFSGEGSVRRIDPRSVDEGSEPRVVEVALVAGQTFDIFEDGDGTVWIGTIRGIGRVDGGVIRYPVQ